MRAPGLQGQKPNVEVGSGPDDGSNEARDVNRRGDAANTSHDLPEVPVSRLCKIKLSLTRSFYCIAQRLPRFCTHQISICLFAALPIAVRSRGMVEAASS